MNHATKKADETGSSAWASVGRFREGLLLLSEGMTLLRQERRLWPLAIVPILFAGIVVGTAILLFWIRFDWIHDAWVLLLPTLEAENWWAWIWVGPGNLLLWIVGWLGVAVAFGILLIAALLLANLMSAPFLDRLSERVEAIVRGAADSVVQQSPGMLRATLRSFRAEFLRLAFLISIWIVLSLSGFILPGAHVVTGPLLLVLTLLFLPLDYAGFALDRRLMSFGARRRWLRANLPTMIGFGGAAFIACMIPGLNLLMTPVLVTAGTILVMRLDPSSGDS